MEIYSYRFLYFDLCDKKKIFMKLKAIRNTVRDFVYIGIKLSITNNFIEDNEHYFSKNIWKPIITRIYILNFLSDKKEK